MGSEVDRLHAVPPGLVVIYLYQTKRSTSHAEMTLVMKHSGAKAPHSDLRLGPTTRNVSQASSMMKVLKWNAGGLTQAKKCEL